MFTLIIVDDHEHIVDSLAATLPWEDVNIKKVYKAYSGTRALELIEQHQIDILVTDIRMPAMSGLELIEQAKEIQPQLQCILMTGYAQFEYAKRAIELRAIDYLIKPVKDEELLEIVGNITENLQMLKKTKQANKKALSVFQQNIVKLRQELLEHILSGQVHDRKVISDKLATYELEEFDGASCRLLLVSMGSYFLNFPDDEQALFDFSIHNIIEEVLSASFHLATCKGELNEWVIIIRNREEDDEHQNEHLEQLIYQAQEHIKTYLKGKVSVYLSRSFQFPDRAVQFYQEILVRVRKLTGKKEHYLIFEDRLSDEDPRDDFANLEQIYVQPSLITLAETSSWQQFQTKLDKIFEELHQDWPYSQAHLSEAFHHIWSCFIYIAHHHGFTLDEVTGSYHPWEKVRNFRSSHQLEDWTQVVFDYILQKLNQSAPVHAHHYIVQQIEDFVGAHLAEDVTLQAIADHVYLHPVYLSKLYKELTGDNISDYIHQQRMKRAKTLLLSTNDKVYEIAQQVGYYSVQYFIKQFKNFYGDTPNVYREHHRNKSQHEK